MAKATEMFATARALAGFTNLAFFILRVGSVVELLPFDFLVLPFLFKFFDSLCFFQSFLLLIFSLLGNHFFSTKKGKLLVRHVPQFAAHNMLWRQYKVQSIKLQT